MHSIWPLARPRGYASCMLKDDPDVRHLVAQALAGTGTIHSVATLAEAMAELAKFEFDTVILDMNLPDGSASALLPPTQEPRRANDTSDCVLGERNGCRCFQAGPGRVDEIAEFARLSGPHCVALM